ncbi:retrotransposon unclassified [Lasius niger]|uniref:Retrotransposon unclassified n=1 Tax=Lasius niger TaxID=67767 RepID=A0A0J7N1T8_LASNI|nr:retrotransposon unclassified [Lasius niger]
MLYAKELPKELWAEAINITVYILNRVPAAGEDKTPYEQWFGKKPSIKHLRVFGTNCYTLIPKQLRKKWEPKSKRGKLVGYTDTDKNYRVWDEERRRVDICRDVKFDNTSELSNTANISLDMGDRGQLQESPAGQSTSDNQGREEEKDMKEMKMMVVN